MVSAINSALSGYQAATQRLHVAASNIANADTTQTEVNGKVTNTPYVPQQVNQSYDPAGGVRTSTQAVSPASQAVYDPGNAAADTNGITQYPNVDVAQQLVNTKIATYNAQGSLSVLKAEKNITQSLLNIIS